MAADKIIVLITGGNSGIGLHAAEILAGYPQYHVIITSRDLENGQAALSSLQELSPRASFSLVQLDVTSPASIEAAASSVEKEYGRLDVLVNNAGRMSFAPTFAEQLREVFETNTFGAAAVTEAFLELLLRSSDARLIYVTSDLGSLTMRADPKIDTYTLPSTAYRMSKAALNMLMLCNHVEYGPKRVKVWAFNPGFVMTNLSGKGEEARRQRAARGAGDAKVPSAALVDIVLGKRDGEVGKYLHKDGEHPW